MTKEERFMEYRRDSILDNMENEPEIDSINRRLEILRYR